MQIDFHHAITYVIARWAGMGHPAAETVAYCSAYVDDATNEGEIHFDIGALYRRLSSAHRMVDYRNFEDLKNRLVWIPFHFLPGNGGHPAGENPSGGFIEKLICRPNSPVAQDMVRYCLLDRDKPYGLHRLGVTAHVFADTWGHKGFAGVNHRVNDVEDIRGAEGEPDHDLIDRIAGYFGKAFQPAVPPLGHGPALSNPDLPYAVWSYTDGLGRRVERDNPTDFTEAADEMCKVFRRFLAPDLDADVSGLADEEKRQLYDMMTAIRSRDGEDRHREWLDAIRNDHFGFGAQELGYRAKGIGSWKNLALGTVKEDDDPGEVFPYSPDFLRSDWKHFHDAAKAHRRCVIDDILPKYGICAA